MRCFVCVATLMVALGFFERSGAAVRSQIIPVPTARRHGLERPWFTQVQLDRSRARISSILLHGGVLYVQTTRAMVHAIDGETGATLWAREVGRPDHPSMTPGACDDWLAVVNGSRLYVCNRYNGDLLFEIQVGGAPGAGPAVSEKRAYVPMVNGLVIAYRLESLTNPALELGKINENPTLEEQAVLEEKRREKLLIRQEFIPPLSCQSIGRTLVQPLVTRQNPGEEYVAWPTDRGHLNVGYIDRNSETSFWVKYRLETDMEISARPTYRPANVNDPNDFGIIYAASRDGFAYGIDERNGQTVWRFSTGEPLVQPPVVIEDNVFLPTQPGGMYCLDATTGREKWWTPQIEQFISASKQRVYALDKVGRTLVLNIDTGARLDTLPFPPLPIKLINDQTDRIYLANHTGLVQCLHEVELTEPIRHGAARLTKAVKQQQPAGRPQDAGGPFGQGQPAGQADPFGNAGNPLGGDGPAVEKPAAGAAGADDDPFGDADNPF